MDAKPHWTDSQNRAKIAPSGRELYHLQFSLQAESPETFGYTLIKQNNAFTLKASVWKRLNKTANKIKGTYRAPWDTARCLHLE
jgi:hypothetical protein